MSLHSFAEKHSLSQVDYLKGWCTSNMRSSVNVMMKSIMTNGVAEQLTLTGREQTLPFKGMLVYHAVCGE